MAKTPTIQSDKGKGNGKAPRLTRKEQFEIASRFVNDSYPNVYTAAEALAVTIKSVEPSDAKSVGVFLRHVIGVTVKTRRGEQAVEREAKKVARAIALLAKSKEQTAKAEKAIAELEA